MALLDVKNLGISFGGLRAVNAFDISIEKEELYGLIGPNGAGKTTVFNLLTGVYRPDRETFFLIGTKCGGFLNFFNASARLSGKNCNSFL